MLVWLAYWSLVIIWSTTPVALSSSNHSLHFLEAGGLRMIFAAIILVIVCRVLGKPIWTGKAAAKNYFVASIGLFPNMALVYWAAQHVPSGVLSIMFAFNPVVIGIFSWFVLKDNPFTLLRTIALAISVLGMGVIYYDQLQISDSSAWAVIALLAAVIGWGASTVWLVSMKIKVDTLAQSTGALLFAIPGYLLCWWWVDGELPSEISLQSAMGVGYLSIFGSAIGGSLYFYILSRIPVMKVSLITLMSPVLALLIGAVLVGEVLSPQLIMGSSLVLVSLLLYQSAPIIRRLTYGNADINHQPSSSPSKGQ